MTVPHQVKINDPLLHKWCQKHQIDFCILFGSAVTGKRHLRSDIDIAISSEQKNLQDRKLQLIGELEDIVKDTVDLVIFHSDMSPLLLYEIMIKGKPLYVADRDKYIEKQIYALKLYDDVPFLKKWQDLSLSIKLARLKDVTSRY